MTVFTVLYLKIQLQYILMQNVVNINVRLIYFSAIRNMQDSGKFTHKSNPYLTIISFKSFRYYL